MDLTDTKALLIRLKAKGLRTPDLQPGVGMGPTIAEWQTDLAAYTLTECVEAANALYGDDKPFPTSLGIRNWIDGREAAKKTARAALLDAPHPDAPRCDECSDRYGLHHRDCSRYQWPPTFQGLPPELMPRQPINAITS